MKENIKLVIKFPIRERMEKFKETFFKYYHMSKDKENTFFYITIDEDDEIMNNKEFIDEYISQYKNVHFLIGNNKNKIEAYIKTVENFKNTAPTDKESRDIIKSIIDQLTSNKFRDLSLIKNYEERYKDNKKVLTGLNIIKTALIDEN